MVDDDSGLFTPSPLLLPELTLNIGIRVLYLSPFVKGLRESVRFSVVSSWMFLALPYPHCRQGSAYHHLQSYH